MKLITSYNNQDDIYKDILEDIKLCKTSREMIYESKCKQSWFFNFMRDRKITRKTGLISTLQPLRIDVLIELISIGLSRKEISEIIGYSERQLAIDISRFNLQYINVSSKFNPSDELILKIKKIKDYDSIDNSCNYLLPHRASVDIENRKLKNEGLKKCYICNIKKDKKLFRGTSSTCVECKEKDRNLTNIELRKDSNSYFVDLYIKQKKLQVPNFSISKEWIIKTLIDQDFRCKYSNIELDYILRSPYHISIDRIDSNIGYIESNCAICAKCINIMKNNYSLDKFFELCEKVTKCTH